MAKDMSLFKLCQQKFQNFLFPDAKARNQVLYTYSKIRTLCLYEKFPHMYL